MVTMAANEDRVLDEDDFRDICRELVSIKANSYQLGVELGIPAGELDVIRKDHHAVDQAFSEVILRWLRQQYNVARFGHPSWKRLIEAVESPVGGNNPALAVEIATSHAPELVKKTQSNVQQKQVMRFHNIIETQGDEGDKSFQLTSMLSLNLERIQAKFASLIMDVEAALETNKVMVTQVRKFLIHKFQGDIDISTCNELSVMFADLTKQKVWTYQHSSPLEILTEKFLHNDQVLQGKIKQYKGDLSGFLLATKLIEYVTLNPLSDEEMEEEEDLPLPKLTKKQYRSLKVVLNLHTRKISELSLDYVHELWEKFAEEFDLPLLTTIIKKIVPGSLEITWLVLQHIVEIIELKSKTPKAVKFFRNHNIVLLQVDGVTVYDEQLMVGYEKLFLETCAVTPTDKRKVINLLNQGVDPNVENSDGNTGLILVSSSGERVVAELLIDKGAKVKHQNKVGVTPLHYASWNGHLGVVKLIIERDAQIIDAQTKEEKNCITALGLACKCGHKAVAELLILKGAKVNYQDNIGFTPLHRASENGHLDVVELLIDKDAQIDVPAKKEKKCVTALGLACECGHKAVAELLILKGAKVNYQDSIGFTPLHRASEKGHLDLVELLIEKDAQVDVPAKEVNMCTTALSLACEAGHKAVAELLIIKGAKVNYQDNVGFTPLHWASQNAHLDVLELLIERGAQIDVPAKDGSYCITALSLACGAGHKSVAELLILKGAKVNYQDNIGFTPLHWASQNGHLDVVELLIQRVALIDVPSVEESQCITALGLACESGHKAVAELLILKGAKVNYQDNAGFTPLHWASRNGHLDVVELLIERDTHIVVPSKEKTNCMTALGLACRYGHKAVAELLILKGAKVNYQDNVGFTPLHWASWNGHLDVVESLIENDAQIVIPSKEESHCTTALGLACEAGHKSVAELLILKGAIVNYQDNTGFTPLHWASQNGHLDVVELLVERDAQIDVPANREESQCITALGLACEAGHKAVTELLILKGAKVNYQDNVGFTPLHWASRNGHLDVVELLIERDAHIILIPSKRKFTALSLACRYGRKAVADLLIIKGAEVNYQDNLGFTPLHRASQNGHLDVVELLIKNDAHVDVPANKEKNCVTALGLACECGHKAVAELLILKGANVNRQNKVGLTAYDIASINGHVEICQLLLRHGYTTPVQDEGLVASPSYYHAMQLRHKEEITPIQTFREIVEHVPQPDLPSKVTEMGGNVASSTDQSMQ